MKPRKSTQEFCRIFAIGQHTGQQTAFAENISQK
jgi:hypothetical protein